MTTATAVSAGPLEYVKTIGITTNQSGRGFINPYDCCFTSDGRILVLNHADAARAALIRIGILNWDEDYIGEFSKGTGRGEGQWMLPIGMAISADQRLHVTDEHLHRVTVFDTEGEFVRMWGEKGDALGQLNGPAGISIAPDGTVYVVEQHNHRVQVFTPKATPYPSGENLATAPGNSTCLGEPDWTPTAACTSPIGETTVSRNSPPMASMWQRTAHLAPVTDNSVDHPEYA